MNTKTKPSTGATKKSSTKVGKKSGKTTGKNPVARKAKATPRTVVELAPNPVDMFKAALAELTGTKRLDKIRELKKTHMSIPELNYLNGEERLLLSTMRQKPTGFAPRNPETRFNNFANGFEGRRFCGASLLG